MRRKKYRFLIDVKIDSWITLYSCHVDIKSHSTVKFINTNLLIRLLILIIQKALFSTMSLRVHKHDYLLANVSQLFYDRIT